MSIAGKPVTFTDAIILRNNSGPLTRLNNVPTLTVARKTANSLGLTGFEAVNFSAAGSFVFQSASLNSNGTYLFVNTSGFGQVTLSLDNGLVGGLVSYVLPAGQFVEFQSDGNGNLT
jgi:hypothetical protein